MLVKMQKGYVAEINVTPFVDVMLVLLVIFMVTAPLLTEGVEVSLPETRAAETLPADEENLVISITAEQNIFLGKTQVSMENLDKVLTQAVTGPGRRLFLQADKTVPYGMVVEVMGQIKAAGIMDLGIAAERRE
ncbi:MAG: ExbD/TolR family protein [Desulfovibrionaceae bacterium]|nr:ExbD/TolR family protein [Desulfovibrionaceae bacterium]